MNLRDKAALIASCIGLPGFGVRDAVNLLIEETRGGLTHAEALVLVSEAHTALADDWVPLREWDGRWKP